MHSKKYHLNFLSTNFEPLVTLSGFIGKTQSDCTKISPNCALNHCHVDMFGPFFRKCGNLLASYANFHAKYSPHNLSLRCQLSVSFSPLRSFKAIPWNFLCMCVSWVDALNGRLEITASLVLVRSHLDSQNHQRPTANARLFLTKTNVP